MSQPPNGTIRACAARCAAWSGVVLKISDISLHSTRGGQKVQSESGSTQITGVEVEPDGDFRLAGQTARRLVRRIEIFAWREDAPRERVIPRVGEDKVQRGVGHIEIGLIAQCRRQ